MASKLITLGLLLTPAMAFPKGGRLSSSVSGTVPAVSANTTTSTSTRTATSTFTTTVVNTVTRVASAALAAESSCGGTVTETTTEKITVTVNPSSVSSAAPASSSPATSTVSLENKRNGETNWAPVAASSAAAAPSVVDTSSSKPASGKGKRGIAYNDASLTKCFGNSEHISWAYNWGQKPQGASGFEYVPMLWGPQYANGWEQNAKDAISNGASAILAFNEPDHWEQATMSPADAAQAYKQYIQPFSGTVRLGSPGVTNGKGEMGLNWLSKFISACSDCTIDFAVIHWYDTARGAKYFKQHVEEAHAQTGLPLWITEFGAYGSDEEVNAFLEEVLPWLDAQDYVERYAYFMARDGLLNKGSEMSTYGRTFATYSG